jgi:GDPmannose 4,6-dehydratase
MNKKALISGITGQDGSYLAEYLLSLNYDVIGLHRRNSGYNFSRIEHFIDHPHFQLEELDLIDSSNCSSVIQNHKPDEFYNLAAQSHVATSFNQPTTTFMVNTTGASTSEMFGYNYSTNDLGKKYQDENTSFMPQSPYGVSKLAAHNIVRIYRSGYGIFGCCGILFNHESPRRGENFVTRKITKYIAQVKNNIIDKNTKLKLGNLSAQRDWGHAKDYVVAMHKMLQVDKPDDYVICTGQTWSVEEFLNSAFKLAGLDPAEYVEIDPNLYRPAEVEYLKGSYSKAKAFLGWEPKVSFSELVKDMVDSDVQKFQRPRI